jgi:hypothetical protein
MRMAIGGVCDVLVTRLSPGHEFNLTVNIIVTGHYSVMSEDISFATFRGCEPGASRNAQILIFKVDDGQYAFVMPRAWTSQFQLPTPSWFYDFDIFLFNSDFEEFKEVVALLPQPMAEYANFDFPGGYIALHKRAVDYLILNYAETHLGKHFAANKLDDAAQQVYEQKENEASYFGITAPVALLVEI